MPEPVAAADREVRLDAALLKRLSVLSSDVSSKLYAFIHRKFARNKDEAAVTLYTFSIAMMLGFALRAMPDLDHIADEINVLWRILGLPFRVSFERVE